MAKMGRESNKTIGMRGLFLKMGWIKKYICHALFRLAIMLFLLTQSCSRFGRGGFNQMHFTGIEGTAPVNSQEGFSSWVNICPPVVDKEEMENPSCPKPSEDDFPLFLA